MVPYPDFREMKEKAKKFQASLPPYSADDYYWGMAVAFNGDFSPTAVPHLFWHCQPCVLSRVGFGHPVLGARHSGAAADLSEIDSLFGSGSFPN